ncbi:hypothetical protein SRHO_G00211830 [Serrasalmus rhombeus]
MSNVALGILLLEELSNVCRPSGGPCWPGGPKQLPALPVGTLRLCTYPPAWWMPCSVPSLFSSTLISESVRRRNEGRRTVYTVLGCLLTHPEQRASEGSDVSLTCDKVSWTFGPQDGQCGVGVPADSCLRIIPLCAVIGRECASVIFLGKMVWRTSRR